MLPVRPTIGSAATREDAAIEITLIGADIRGDALTFAIATNPMSGSLGLITPIAAITAEVIYTPNLDFLGADSFTFTVNDQQSKSDAATVVITVDPINDAPTFIDSTATSVLEDARPQSIANWAAFDSGTANELQGVLG